MLDAGKAFIDDNSLEDLFDDLYDELIGYLPETRVASHNNVAIGKPKPMDSVSLHKIVRTLPPVKINPLIYPSVAHLTDPTASRTLGLAGELGRTPNYEILRPTDQLPRGHDIVATTAVGTNFSIAYSDNTTNERWYQDTRTKYPCFNGCPVKVSLAMFNALHKSLPHITNSVMSVLCGYLETEDAISDKLHKFVIKVMKTLRSFTISMRHSPKEVSYVFNSVDYRSPETTQGALHLLGKELKSTSMPAIIIDANLINSNFHGTYCGVEFSLVNCKSEEVIENLRAMVDQQPAMYAPRLSQTGNGLPHWALKNFPPDALYAVPYNGAGDCVTAVTTLKRNPGGVLVVPHFNGVHEHTSTRLENMTTRVLFVKLPRGLSKIDIGLYLFQEIVCRLKTVYVQPGFDYPGREHRIIVDKSGKIATAHFDAAPIASAANVVYHNAKEYGCSAKRMRQEDANVKKALKERLYQYKISKLNTRGHRNSHVITGKG